MSLSVNARLARALWTSQRQLVRIKSPLSSRARHMSTPRMAFAPVATKQLPQQRGLSSAPETEDWKIWDFKEVKELVASKNPNITIIDVREPHEYADGHLPLAENMPIKTSPDGLFLSASDFEERFGFPKPKADSAVLFYCRSGVRSKASATLARQAGFVDVGEYRGSWLDWEGNGGEVVK